MCPPRSSKSIRNGADTSTSWCVTRSSSSTAGARSSRPYRWGRRAGRHCTAAAAPSVAEVNLTEEQIRQIQIVLNEKGFSIGRPDGRLGPRTIRALTAFQRRQGLEVSGRLDSRTVAALGVSNVSGARGGAQGAGQSSTTGQGGAGSQQAPAQQNQGARKPSTSGQGSSQQTPAQRNPGSSQRPANEQHENAGSK